MPKTEDLKGHALVMITRDGVIKKVSAENFADVRRSGIIALSLSGSDELVGAFLTTSGDSIAVASALGQSIRFKESNVRAMGRTAGGVRGIKLSKADKVIGAGKIAKDDKDVEMLVISQNGYGKKTAIKEYKIQKRGGSGIKTAKVTPKTGKLISSMIVSPEDSEIVAISKKSKVIRLALSEIPSLGRQTQGVRIMKLKEGDSLASVVAF